MESERWSEAGTSVQMLTIFQTAPWDAVSGQCQAGCSLYAVNAVQLGRLQECFCFKKVFSSATFSLFIPQHNLAFHTVKWQVVKCFIQ